MSIVIGKTIVEKQPQACDDVPKGFEIAVRNNTIIVGRRNDGVHNSAYG